VESGGNSSGRNDGVVCSAMPNANYLIAVFATVCSTHPPDVQLVSLAVREGLFQQF
jgi:hypothetical protein